MFLVIRLFGSETCLTLTTFKSQVNTKLSKEPNKANFCSNPKMMSK